MLLDIQNRWALRVCLFVFQVLSISKVFAQQQIQLEVMPPYSEDFNEAKVYLLKFDKDRYYMVDSITINSDRKINFIVNEESVRMYSMRYSNYPDMEFIVSNTDNEISISTNDNAWKNNDYKIAGSNENYCWSAIQKAQKQFQQQSSEWLTKKYQLDKFDPRLLHKYDTYDSLFNISILEFNSKMDEIAKWYPKAFCGSLLAQNSKLPSRLMTKEWQKEFDNDFAFWHQHYFHFLSFNDIRLLNFPHFKISFDTYLKNYTQQTNDGLKHFVDLVFTRNMAPEVREFLTEFYLQYFMGLNNEDMVLYLLQKDEDNCETDVKTSDLIQTLKSLKKGLQAPEIILTDLDGHQKKLSESCKKKGVTALVFFSPTCPHCHELLKELAELKDQNVDALNVFTIASGNKEVTEKFVSENQYDWITCVYERLSSQEVNPFNDYAVLKVPTLVLIDSDQKLITRFGNLNVLKATLGK